MSNPKDILDEALKNIRDDRVASNQLLFDLSQEIASGETDLARSGMVAAKYVEALQRSNEQLVKVVTVLMKKMGPEDLELSEEEKDNIFEIIQGTGTDNE